MPKVIGIIPSRYQSQRFPGKPLAILGGLPLIIRVMQSAMESRCISEVYVATDDERIAETVRKYNGKVLLTSSAPPTGSDRVAEAAKQLTADYVINIQGDEPLIAGSVLDKVITALDDPDVVMSTACSEFKNPSDIDNPNIVKAVLDKSGYAMYFSRSRIPYVRSGDIGTVHYYRHIGIYGFKRDFLLKYSSLERTPLEIAENLEQLRALEHGFKIKTVITEFEFIGIDSKEDLMKAEKILINRGL